MSGSAEKQCVDFSQISGFVNSLPAVMSNPSSSSASLVLSEDSVQRRICNELLSISSKASCNMEWRCSGFTPDGQNEPIRSGKTPLSLSNSFEEIFCPQLPGQVPVEPPETSNNLAANGVSEASAGSNISTEPPVQPRKKKGFCSLLKRVWKFIKRPFRGCSCCSSVDVVEPFVPPPDLEKESDPEMTCADFKPNKKSFKSLYKVENLIGSGGFGKVYKGTRKSDGKKVAIKRMRKIDNVGRIVIPGYHKPLVTEVALLLMMRKAPISPYTIQLYDWFEHPRKYTLIMELPEPCQNLLEFLMNNPLPNERTARGIMRQTVRAVQDCIEHGVFHNDIHPQNLLLNTDTLEVKLIDFGSGHLFSSDGYDCDAYIGLLAYCPPEALLEERFQAIPTNVWFLGVLLYEMMNGCCPFRNTDEIVQCKFRFQKNRISQGNNILGLLSLAEGLDLILEREDQP